MLSNWRNIFQSQKLKKNTNMKKMKISIYVICCTFLISIVTVVHAQNKKPNIVIIMADDLDSHELSCYGGQNIKTTHIDALAEKGLKFNQMIASEAMCIPTRASMFTGLYPVKHGAYQNHKAVKPNLKSIVHYLNDEGYKVGLTGKDHVTKPKETFPFEIIDGFETNCVATSDEYFLDSIKNYITKDQQPYCLFIMSCNPHAPWTVGDPTEFDASKLVLPKHWVDTKLIRTQFTKYLAEVRRLDNQVGDIMQLLKDTNQDENTIVIFLGEQGPQFAGGKWTLFDNGVKSSMIIKWPNEIKMNTETNAIVQYEDLTPTLIEIAGGKAPKNLDGSSFLKVLKGHGSKHREYAYLIHNNIPEGPPYPMRGVRSEHYKLITNYLYTDKYYIKYMMNPDNPRSSWNTWMKRAQTDPQAKLLTERIHTRPAIEFYDLQNDPNELNNLATNPKYKKLLDKYEKKLQKWMVNQGDKGASLDVKLK